MGLARDPQYKYPTLPMLTTPATPRRLLKEPPLSSRMPTEPSIASSQVSHTASRIPPCQSHQLLWPSRYRISTVSSSKHSINSSRHRHTNTQCGNYFTPSTQTRELGTVRAPVPATSNVVTSYHLAITPRQTELQRLIGHSRTISQKIPSKPVRTSQHTETLTIRSFNEAPILQQSSAYRSSCIDESRNTHVGTSFYRENIMTSHGIVSSGKQEILATGTSIQNVRISETTLTSPAMVGSVTVHSVPQAPIIRNPPRKSNKLYKSAVEGKRGLSLSVAGSAIGALRTSRAHSTCPRKRSTKNREVLIRGNYRSIVSDKRIKVLGSYHSTDKSNTFMLREFSQQKDQKLSASRVISKELQEVIPTQIIKIPISTLPDNTQLQRSRSITDQTSLYRSESGCSSILDEPGLIKKMPSRSNHLLCDSRSVVSSGTRMNVSEYSFSSSRSRLCDDIRISVYKSPSVVIKEPELITSGPKLSKPHVMRVEVQGKVLTSYQYPAASRGKSNSSGRLSQRSNSPKARYETKKGKYYNLTVAASPYHKLEAKELSPRGDDTFKPDNTSLHPNTCLNSSSVPAKNLGTKESPNAQKVLLECSKISYESANVSTSTHLVDALHTSPNGTSQITTKFDETTLLTADTSIAKRQQGFSEFSEQKIQVEKEKVMHSNDYFHHTNRNKTSLFSSTEERARQGVISRSLRGDVCKVEEEEIQDNIRYLLPKKDQKDYASTLTIDMIHQHQYTIPKLPSNLEEEIRKMGIKGNTQHN